MRNNEDLYLRTATYDIYTGSGFEKADKNSEKQPFAPELLVLSFLEYNSFDIKIAGYDSNILPLPPTTSFVETIYHQDQQTGENLFSSNQYDEVSLAQSLDRNDEFKVHYFKENSVIGNNVWVNSFEEVNITESNTQLPETVTQRTKDLATQLQEDILYDFLSPQYNHTEVEDYYNDEYLHIMYVYSMSGYIRNYLAYTYPYTTTPDEVEGVDFVDSFLFEHQEGYCVSFASSMLVLLRSLDIPCRYVSGYYIPASVDGEYQEVTDFHKHAWVEVYLPNVGYAIFDATPASWVDSEINGNPIDEVEETTQTTETTETTEFTIETTSQTTLGTTESTEEEIVVTEKEYDFTSLIPALITVGSVLLLSFGIIFFLSYKNKVIHLVLLSKNPTTIYKSTINLLEMVKIKRKNQETVRDFMINAYEILPLYHSESHSERNRKTTPFDDFNPHLLEQREQIICTIEKILYGGNENIDNLDLLITFRNDVSSYVKEKKGKLFYLIFFKNIK